LLVTATACGDTRASQRTPLVPLAVGEIGTIVGTGQRATDPVDGDADGRVDPAIWALDAHLDTPMDTLPAADGTLYVIDWNGHKIRALGADGMLSFVAGTGTEGDACEADETNSECPATSAELNHPTDLFIDGSNAMWIAAWHNSKLKRLDAQHAFMKDICGTGNRKFEGDGGPCRDAAGMDLVSFDLPSGIVVDAAGNVFISDQSNQVVRRIGPDGIIKTVAGNCPGTPGFGCPKGRGYSGDGGPATRAQLNNNIGQGTGPHGKIAFDTSGNLYIADSVNNAVRKVTPGSDGVLGDGDPAEEIMTTIAGTGEDGYSGDGGPATEAQLSAPTDVAVALDGSVFIADSINGCVRRVDSEGMISTVAGVCGQIGDSGDGGPATQAQLRSPSGVSLDGHGGLFIADALNNRIRKVLLE
jgi:streptogramin lyase